MNKATGTNEAHRLAATLNELREANNLTVEAISTQTGIPLRTLYRKLNTTPEVFTLRELRLITEALNTPLTITLGGVA